MSDIEKMNIKFSGLWFITRYLHELKLLLGACKESEAKKIPRLTLARQGRHVVAFWPLSSKFRIPKSIFKNFYLSLKSYFLILKTMHEKKIFRFLKFFHSIFVVDTDDFSKKKFFSPKLILPTF